MASLNALRFSESAEPSGGRMPSDQPEHAMNSNAEPPAGGRVARTVRRERWAILKSIIRLTEQPMLILSLVWLALVVLDLMQGLNRPLQIASLAIWILFILDFLLQFIVAPHKWAYLRRNWLTGISIVLPAFKVFSVFRAFRALRVIRAGGMVRGLGLLTSIRRSLQSLGRTLGRRGFGYVFALTMLCVFLGAAGMYHFENPSALVAAGYGNATNMGLHSYAEALWWTAMLITTMGSDYWPKTPEGRMLCLGIAVFAFTVFGYLTATLASHFIRTDEEKPDGKPQ
jgi:voltage-gated potassium channel